MKRCRPAGRWAPRWLNKNSCTTCPVSSPLPPFLCGKRRASARRFLLGVEEWNSFNRFSLRCLSHALRSARSFALSLRLGSAIPRTLSGEKSSLRFGCGGSCINGLSEKAGSLAFLNRGLCRAGAVMDFCPFDTVIVVVERRFPSVVQCRGSFGSPEKRRYQS